MSKQPATSPIIMQLSWGKMRVEGIGAGRDFKLWPGGGRPWDWRETGTHHEPGIQPADVEELLENGSSVIILSRGVLKRLQVAPETMAYLEERGTRVHIKETKAAAALYNELAESGERVGGLFHSTC